MACADRAQQLLVRELALPSLQAFKVVGDQTSVLDYDAAHPPRVVGDWSAIYLQFDVPHSLGTVGYRWDMGYKTANLLRVNFREVNVVLLDAVWFADGDVPGGEKARLVKQALAIGEEELLTEALGRRSQVLVCRETASQWELVLPRGVLPLVLQSEEIAHELRPNEFGMTSHWRRTPADAWTKYDETVALQDVAEPAWILQALQTDAATEAPMKMQ
eukprot:TRINITY_DN20898_c0_g1_i8.p1 TRINITY_DN20898_c0_g1~~TRINITY_DN20898_c0_g1_i8.p1  ORF type:complete len:232 (+),score=59.11 TRINITY_DN20898_c0_g1_i8:46-696(+)